MSGWTRLFAPLAFDPHHPAGRRDSFAGAMKKMLANDGPGALAALRGLLDTANP